MGIRRMGKVITKQVLHQVLFSYGKLNSTEQHLFLMWLRNGESHSLGTVALHEVYSQIGDLQELIDEVIAS